MNNNLAKQNFFIFCAIACAALGFVLGVALFDPSSVPLVSHGQKWLFVAALLYAVFALGLILEYLLGKLGLMTKPSRTPRNLTKIREFRRAIERRFRGDRTDEEYQKAENGVVLLVAVGFLIAMLFSIGGWVIAAIAIFIWLGAFADIYSAIKAVGSSPKVQIVIPLIAGVFFGIGFGYFMGPS
ncbi:hypothetical protein [uncultured Agrobacterium sp.]|uniref:hypothetical protein n=1 Tax=uncultured Agrobacterium sp. TaxID=157277 RepID=UPI00258BD6A9|nr:hypothetical protein [uncultured Agrobacterium sp.]